MIRLSKSGFSIIEVVLTLTLMAILVTFALPQFSEWVGQSEVSVEKYTIGCIEEGLNNLYAQKFANGTANQGSDYPPNPFDALDIKSNYVPLAEFDWSTKNRWTFQPTGTGGNILHTRSNGDTYFIVYSFTNSVTPGIASTYQITNPADGSKDMSLWQ